MGAARVAPHSLSCGLGDGQASARRGASAGPGFLGTLVPGSVDLIVSMKPSARGAKGPTRGSVTVSALFGECVS